MSEVSTNCPTWCTRPKCAPDADGFSIHYSPTFGELRVVLDDEDGWCLSFPDMRDATWRAAAELSRELARRSADMLAAARWLEGVDASESTSWRVDGVENVAAVDLLDAADTLGVDAAQLLRWLRERWHEDRGDQQRDPVPATCPEWCTATEAEHGDDDPGRPVHVGPAFGYVRCYMCAGRWDFQVDASLNEVGLDDLAGNIHEAKAWVAALRESAVSFQADELSGGTAIQPGSQA